MFFASWQNIIETSKEVKVSWGRIQSDGRQNEELDESFRIDKASAIMQAFHHLIILKLSKEENLSVFKLIFVPFLTYSNESWEMTESVRSQMQASEMRFLRKIRSCNF